MKIAGLNGALIRKLGGRHKGVCTAPHYANAGCAVIPPDYIRAHNMVRRGKHQKPRPGDWVCTRCNYYNHARHSR